MLAEVHLTTQARPVVMVEHAIYILPPNPAQQNGALLLIGQGNGDQAKPCSQ